MHHKIQFDSNQIGKNLSQEYDIPEEYKVFRYAYHEQVETAKALFIIFFQLKHMSVQQNIRFSLIPMQVIIRLKGFRSKYWLCNETTNSCCGVYRFATLKDAEKYANSLAVWFMKKRSVEGSVSFSITSLSPDPSLIS